MKDRVTHESQMLYVGPATTGVFEDVTFSGFTPTQLYRIQSVEHYVDTNKENIYQIGSLNSLGTARPEPPVVGLEFSYLLGDAQNEKWLGFDLSDLTVPAISGFLSGISDEQNFYLVSEKRGDIVTTGSTEEFLGQADMATYGFGNAVIENYTIEASIVELPTATVLLNVNNMTISSGCSGISNPAVDFSGCSNPNKVIIPPARKTELEVDALRAPNINLTFGPDLIEGGGPLLPGNDVLPSQSTCSLESFALSLELERTEVGTLGNPFISIRKIGMPSQVGLECVAKMRDIASGNMLDMLCGGNQDIIITMDNPNNSSGNMQIGIKGAHVQSRNFNQGLAGSETVSLNFITPLGAGDIASTGFYLSGVANKVQSTSYGITSGQLLNNQFAER